MAVPIIGALGDVIEDIVVDMHEAIRFATDSSARIHRRRGGSAANVAVGAVVAGCAARFIGSVGADELGDRLLGQLATSGVDCAVKRSGRTGTVVALIDEAGERSLLTDRGSSSDLEAVDLQALEGLSALHVPAYAFTAEPLAAAAETALVEAALAGITTSVDASAVPVIEYLGPDGFRALMKRVEPTVLFCNADEARALDAFGPIDGVAVTVVKQGPDDVLVFGHAVSQVRVPAVRVDNIVDTTGAGDAFAAGFLCALSRDSLPADCAKSGHELAALALVEAGSLQHGR